jgi:hypothetical protein
MGSGSRLSKLSVAVFFALLVPSGLLAAIEGVPGVDFHGDRFIISVHRGVVIMPADLALGSGQSTGDLQFDQLAIREKITRVEEFYPQPVKNEILRDVVKRMFVLYVGPDGNLESAISTFAADSRIEFAEPYFIHHLCYVPNDPLISSWYHLTNIQAYLAWDFIRGDSTSRPVLGVVDSGVYWDHPDLWPNMWFNFGEDTNGDSVYTEDDVNGIDDEGNGLTDDFFGWDYGNNDNNPFEPIPWHGTHVSGCATMSTDNDNGGAATAWGARIMAVKAARDSNPNSIPFGYTGITYAADNGATVINLSWGRGGSPSSGEQNIITAAYNLGVAVVAAAGNDNSSGQFYPARYEHVVAVAAVGPTDRKSSFSNYGAWIDVSAPGEGVWSTWDHDLYTTLDGTSMASPIVSGVVCLIRAARPSLTVDEVVDVLKNNADNIDSLNPGFEGMLGTGRVNAGAAIGRDIFPHIVLNGSSVAVTEDDGDGRLNPGERFNLVVTFENEWQDAFNVTGTLASDGQFIVLDSVADFGNINGNGGQGDNSSNPFDVRVNLDASIGPHIFTVHISADPAYQSDVEVSVSVTLEQAGFPADITAYVESPVMVLNIDGDPGKEIIVGSNDHNYYMFESDGSPSPGWPQAVSNNTPGGAACGDLDNDGDIEIVGMSQDANIYAWDANGTIITSFPRALGSNMFGTPVLADIDGDSTLEIIAGTYSSSSVYVLDQNGADFGTWPFVASGNFYGSAAVGDIDNDGLNEILFGAQNSELYAWNADKSYVPGFPVTLAGQIRTPPAIVDLDDDGNLNIVVRTGTSLYVLDNDGSIMPGWPVQPGGNLFSSPAVSDIDLDGQLEIVAASNNWNVYVYNWNGEPQSGFPVQTGGVITASVAIGDLTGDYFPDIVVGSYDGKINAFHANGQPLPNFPIQAAPPGSQIKSSSALADIDGDGDCEVITGLNGPSFNLDVIDYKYDTPLSIFPWPMFGKNIQRTSNYGEFIVGLDDNPALPNILTLAQNFPNPFNAATTISFSLPAGANVELVVYDLLGRKIRNLVTGFRGAGDHTIIWDGAGDSGLPLSSGIYFYRLQVGSDVVTKRMTMLK